MPAKPSGEIQTSIIRVKQKNGDIYIFERRSLYVPEKKYNKILGSKLIAKIPKGQEQPVPTRHKRKKGEPKEEIKEEIAVQSPNIFEASGDNMQKSSKKLTEDPLLLRILGILNEQGKTDKALTDYLGLRPGTMSHWKYDGNSTAYLQHILPICEFLNTTPNYLFYGEDKADELGPLEAEILGMLRRMDVKRRQCLRDAARFFLAAEHE